MILEKGLKCYWNFLTVVSFRILTALLCLVAVPVACFLCVCPAFGILAKKNIKKNKKKKKKSKKKTKKERKKSGKNKKQKNQEPHPISSTLEVSLGICVSSEHPQMRQAIILFVTLGTFPLLCGVCVGSILSSATILISPSDTGLLSRTFVTCNTNKWQPQWCSVSFWMSSGSHI